MCAPGMMDEQARDVMIRFATSHPESRRYSAGRQIAEAFSNAFPCPPVVADDVSRRFRVRPAADPTRGYRRTDESPPASSGVLLVPDLHLMLIFGLKPVGVRFEND